MSGNKVSAGAVNGFEEPTLIQAYLLAFTSRIIGGYYRKYVESIALKGDEQILEYGSGSGAASRYLARALPNGRLTCVDISKVWMRFVKRAVGKYPNVEFLQGDLAGLEIKDEAYDGIFIHFVLHDIPRPSRVEKVKILARKLKQGGKIYLREPTGENHGMPAAEIRAIMAAAGLAETSPETGISPERSPTFQAIYVK